MNRAYQVVLIGSTLLGSWLGMQMIHELGHVLGACLTGASVTQVVLSPLTISRTDVSNNSCPLVVLWAGPIVGVTLPLLFWLIAHAARVHGSFILRFFAGFSLVANGLYIGLGSFGGIGDCGEMLRHGSALWPMWLFGLVTVPAGLSLWHRQGTAFGLGSARGEVSHQATYVSVMVCIALIVLGFAIGGR